MRILVIQAGSLYELVQTTGFLENLNQKFPGMAIDLIIRPGNRDLFDNHPYIHNLISWDKSQAYKNMRKIVKQLSHYTYDYVFNLETRFLSGLLTKMVKGKTKLGFRNHLMAFAYKYRVPYERNDTKSAYNRLLTPIFQPEAISPVLYPHEKNYQLVKRYKKHPYICVAPVPENNRWKEPVETWTHFVNSISTDKHVYLLGEKKDWDVCEILLCGANPEKVHNFAGKLSALEIAALLKDASANYLNNTGIKSIAESLNAPVDVYFQQAS